MKFVTRLLAMSVLLSSAFAPAIAAAESIRLATQFTGTGSAMQVWADGPFQGMAQMVPRNGDRGQNWIVTSEPQGDWVRLRNEATGNSMCLDVTNGGDPAYMVRMQPCANYSGQLWRISGSDDRMRFTTQFLGESHCLDVVNGGMMDRFLRMAPCGNYSGQLWNLNP